MEETDCKNIVSMIPAYLDGSLDADDTKRLLGHLNACDECRYEMEINFLLVEGIRRVEKGETLDLNNELDRRLKESERYCMMLDRIKAGIYIIEGTAAFMLAACLLVLISHRG